MPFRIESLLPGGAIVVILDLLLLWQMPRIVQWHSRALESFLRLAEVPWQAGREMVLWPGLSVILLRTSYLDYHDYPLVPGYIAGASLGLFFLGYRRWPAPLKPLLFLLPAALLLTLVYLKTVSASVPYTPEDFCAIWYRGEVYLWLLLPVIFAASFFILNVPFLLKIGWLSLLMFYSFLWSAVRLALALATFYYFGSIWMPFFYFAFGFLADFLYIVAFYSLAMDGAAGFLAKQQEAWK